MVYALRIAGQTWQPHVFAAGKYALKISDPEGGKSKQLSGLMATPGNETNLEVNV